MVYIILILLAIFIYLYLCKGVGTGRNSPKTILKPSKVRKVKVITLNENHPIKQKDMIFEDADIQYYALQKNKQPEHGTFTEILPKSSISLTQPLDIMNDYNNYAEQDIHDIIELLNIEDINTPPHAPYRPRPRHRPRQTIQPAQEVGLYDPNSQNVHDTVVGSMVRNIYSNINLVNKPDFNTEDLVNDVKQYAAGKEHYDKVSKVLAEVKMRNSIITNVNNLTELELLASIWKKACSENEETEKNIKDMLIEQIADTVGDYDTVLCPTGFTNRIATALVVEDPEKMPKTKELFHAEIMETAANLRNELEKDNAYNDLDDDKKSSEYKEKLNEKLEKDYDGVLSKDDIKNIVAPWIDHI